MRLALEAAEAAGAAGAADEVGEVPAYPAAAWRCSAGSQEALVGKLVEGGLVAHPAAVRALRETDRAHYVREEGAEGAGRQGRRRGRGYAYGPYADAPQALGYGQTVSAPHAHAMALELLAPTLARPAARALDVGCGSGALTAAMARAALAGAGAADAEAPLVVGVERVPELAAAAARNIAADDPALLAAAGGPVVVRCGDGLAEAAAERYDAIHVGAAADGGVPEPLLALLAPGGRMLVPVGGGTQQAWLCVDRAAEAHGAGVSARVVTRVRYVPLLPGVAQQAGKDGAAEGWRRRRGRRRVRGRGEASAGAEVGANAASAQRPRAGHGRDVVAGRVDYDARYARGWVYGRAPSARVGAFARGASSERLAARGGAALVLGAGQGRNAVCLAEAGWQTVIAVDSSSVGLAKCEALAAQRGVSERVVCVRHDLRAGLPPAHAHVRCAECYDAVVSAFFALPRRARAALHAECSAALADGGAFVYENFSAAYAGTSGPPRAWLPTREKLAAELPGVAFEAGEDVSERLEEGRFHHCDATLTRVVGAKRSVRAVGRAGGNGAAPAGLVADVDAVFAEHADYSASLQAKAARGTVCDEEDGVAATDALLERAPDIVAVACHEATRASVCRYCWMRPPCVCQRVADAARAAAAADDGTGAAGTPREIRWVIATHACEFLRSTASARTASCALEALCEATLERAEGRACTLAVVGGSTAGDAALAEALSLCPEGAKGGAPVCVLYPNAPGGRQCVSVREALAACTRGRGVGTASANAEALTVIVPDGSSDNAAALVDEIERRCPGRLSYVALDPAEVARCVAVAAAAPHPRVYPPPRSRRRCARVSPRVRR